MAFDQASWATGKGDATGKNPRSQLVADARAAGVRVGASRKAIRGLLGEPDGQDAAVDVWFLGRAEFAVDYRVLRVTYDGDGVATAVDEQSR